MGMRRAAQDCSDPIAIRRAALNLLARRDYAVGELRSRLRERFDAAELIDAELGRLVAEHLLDEQRFIEAFVRMHRNRGHGPLRVLRELHQRGVDELQAEGGVDPGSQEWAELARAWRARKFGAALPESAADWQRQARHLQQRGFSGEQVRHALRGDAD